MLFLGIVVAAAVLAVPAALAKEIASGGTVTPAAPAPVELKGFEIAGTNRQWFAAKAVIDGATVLVSHDQVAEPVAVRYAWGDYPPCDLYNKEGLPAVPFRTDNWNP